MNIVGVISAVGLIAAGSTWTTKVTLRLDTLTSSVEALTVSVASAASNRWRWTDHAAWQKQIERELDRWVVDLERDLNRVLKLDPTDPGHQLDLPHIDLPDISEIIRKMD